MKVLRMIFAAPAVPLSVWRASNFGLKYYLMVEKGSKTFIL